jgi:hypothetical protein
VGEYVVHICFLLGLKDLGQAMVEKYFYTEKLINIPYADDLEPWKSSVVDRKSFDCGLYTGETILHIAIITCDEEVVRFLLERGASLSARARGVFFMPEWIPEQNKHSFFHRIKSCFLSFTHAEVNKNHNEYSQCAYGEFPLSFAASIGKVDICKLLYAHAVRTKCMSIVCAEDSFGNTAMHMAVLHKQPRVVDWLMTTKEGKACLDTANKEGLTPLNLAVRHGDVEMYNYVLYTYFSRVAWVFGEVRAPPTVTRPCPEWPPH